MREWTFCRRYNAFRPDFLKAVSIYIDKAK